MKDLIRQEKHSILVIQEKKLENSNMIELGKKIWRDSIAVVFSTRGALGRLCMIWRDCELEFQKQKL